METFVRYKAMAAGVAVDAVRPHYTSQTCHRCGSINKRHKYTYVCARCGHKAHADANAAMNIRDWHGLCCPYATKLLERHRKMTPYRFWRTYVCHLTMTHG
jgi:transposase